MTDIVVITGSARGIGLELALKLSAEHGYHVFAGVRKEVDLAKFEAQTKGGAIGKGHLTPIMMDVTKADELQAAAEKISKTAGTHGVNGIITCQGMTPLGLLEFADIDRLNAAYDVQLNGNIRVFQAFAKHMRQNGDARFIMLSSPMNHLGLPTMGTNALNRGATDGLANTLRLETAGQGIHVSVIWPLGIRGGTVEEAEGQLGELEEKTKNIDAWAPYANTVQAFMSYKSAMAWDTGEVGPDVVVPAELDALQSEAPEFRYTVGQTPPGDVLPSPSRAFHDLFMAKFWPK